MGSIIYNSDPDQWRQIITDPTGSRTLDTGYPKNIWEGGRVCLPSGDLGAEGQLQRNLLRQIFQGLFT